MASNTFSLKIISANRVFFTGRCQSVIVPGYDGQKEVLAHHENMVIAVNEGEMRFLPEGEEKWQYAVVGIGFIEIVNNRVTLLVESVERPEEIDIARAQEAKERAEELWKKYVRNRVFRSIIIHRLPFPVRWRDFGLDIDRNMFKML